MEKFKDATGEEIIRVRMPRNEEVFGIVEEMLGAGRFRIACSDGKKRVCRVSGKFKRKQWIRSGDTVLVKPWEVQGDEKGDVIWKYKRAETEWLRKKGLLNF
ncbi:MAG: translation initiation factor eIF-1A [Candidatus Aenigmarchaeota archaeon]|nr:translation initiation factor eIF-1A [Candidatus Aenigmarchaeota archaeon]